LAVDLALPLLVPVGHDDRAKSHLPHPLNHPPCGGDIGGIAGHIQSPPAKHMPINGEVEFAVLKGQNLVPRHRSSTSPSLFILLALSGLTCLNRSPPPLPLQQVVLHLGVDG